VGVSTFSDHDLVAPRDLLRAKSRRAILAIVTEFAVMKLSVPEDR
jgi:hypothetical protein